MKSCFLMTNICTVRLVGGSFDDNDTLSMIDNGGIDR